MPASSARRSRPTPSARSRPRSRSPASRRRSRTSRTRSTRTTQAFFQTSYLWLTAPFVVFGIVRFLMLVSGRAGRGLKSESPTQEMLSDVPFVLNLVAWCVVVVAIVYRLRPG